MIGGFLAGFVLEEVGERRGTAASLVACGLIGVAAVVIGISAASGSGLIHGSTGL